MKLVMKIWQKLKSFHQKQLSSESKIHQDFEAHSFKNLFKQTEINHFRSHAQMNFWFKIKKKNSTVKKQQVLNCMWVYVYKFTKKNVDKMQDMSSSARWSANQVKFCQHLHSHFDSSFFSCVYDVSSLIWSETYSIWHHQCFHACKSEWNCLHENVRQILKD